MDIKTALRADEKIRMALVGAGGKSSTMFQLARELSCAVIVTSTTHLGRDQVKLADRHIIVTDVEQISRIKINKKEVLLVTGGSHNHERIFGLEPDLIDRLHEFCEAENVPMIIEADGSKRKPLKAPAQYEPPVPPWVNYVVVVEGYSGIGQIFSDEYVHRPEIFRRLTGIRPGEKINCQHLVKMLLHENGGLKNVPVDAEKAVMITQVDSDEKRREVMKMDSGLFRSYHRLVIANRKKENTDGHDENSMYRSIVCSVLEPVAAIILAAGGATRYGEAKVMLPWRGKPLVRWVAETALNSGLSPLIVVLGAVQQPVRQALNGLPVRFIENQQWETGQSTSVITGIRSLPSNTGAAVVMLADQPQIPIDLIDDLVKVHRESLATIIAPSIDGRRANPVLLDKTIFRELLSLQGDTGAREIFSRHPVTYVHWDDDSILLDVDTPEDYQKLLHLP